jgi:16S rRNA (adenine1518-N6/adenine1519-N6)-dimethyltransferase
MKNIKELIKNNNFNFKKHFGQNFIKDPNILNKIVESANIDKNTLVIEIGVGAGALTTKLSNYASKVIGYEIDISLKPILNDIIEPNSNIEIIYDDFLKRDIKNDISDYQYQKLYIVANLPYYITTPIITKIIDDKLNVDKMIIMVQKEVGDRFSARPNSKEYNSLTIFLNYYFNIKKLFKVSRSVFIPAPNVDSIVLEMTKNDKDYGVIDDVLFFKLVKDAFCYKRKNLRNNLKEYDLKVIEDTLSQYKLDLTVRAEQLTLEQFVHIANSLKLSK